MTIDPKQYLVIIKGKDHTGEILRITREDGCVVITYKNNKIYRFAQRNVELLSNPKQIPVENYRLSISGDILSEVAEALRFGNWVKIFHNTGFSRCCLFSALSVQPMSQCNGRSKDVLAYFRELADGAALKTNEGDSLLAMKYRQLDIISRHSILSGFLQGKSLNSEPILSEISSRLIFPFSYNMSQKKAIRKSLLHPVTIIKGPRVPVRHKLS